MGKDWRVSVVIIPFLVDEKILADEIARLSKILPPEKLDCGGDDHTFCNELVYHSPADGKGNESQYELATRPKGWIANTKGWREVHDLIHLLVYYSWRDEGVDEPLRSADLLFQFTTACLSGGLSVNTPLNEYGFKNSTIIGPANAWRLRALFAQIDFQLLRFVFDKHRQLDRNGDPYTWVTSMDELKKYVGWFDTMLEEAIRKNKVLYMYAA
jgi:hypothetical protein